MIVDGVLITTWSLIPDSLRQLVPSRLSTGIAVVILVLGVLGRLIQQETSSFIDKTSGYDQLTHHDVPEAPGT